MARRAPGESDTDSTGNLGEYKMEATSGQRPAPSKPALPGRDGQSRRHAIQEMPPIKGLSELEVVARQVAGQGNDAGLKPSRSYVRILFENLFTFFNIVLFGLGILLVILGQPIDAFFTTGVALLNTAMAVAQEGYAKHKLDQIALLTRPEATVIRDSRVRNVDQTDVVLGDVLVIRPGDQIVVDGVVVGQQQMDVDESMLSGEAEFVHKSPGDVVYSGSYCVAGQGLVEAERVGADSFIYQMTASARTLTRNLTPLQREINLVIRVLLAVIVCFGLLLTINSILTGGPFVESVRNTSVVFGLAPSSLFLTIVVAYAVGAVRIANKGALVQQANSVESLCHVSLICFDKTGTLTANRLKLHEVQVIPGNGHSQREVTTLLTRFANSVSVTNQTTTAIAAALPGKGYEVLDEVPFVSARKWSGLVFGNEELEGAYVLGAPEVLQSRLINDAGNGQYWRERTAHGLRVLLFAHDPTTTQISTPDGAANLPDSLQPLCWLSFSDELRPDAQKTLDAFSRAGIEQKIISGDHPETVTALAQQAGFGRGSQPLVAISGPELARLDDVQFAEKARQATIFGRIEPEQKARLIRTFRDQGHYVAMTGDGVNDVLALKQANVGVAMESGSQATRTVADMILLNDSFSVLPHAFVEGQRILQGMQDILRLYLTRILYLTLLITTVSIIGVGFPFTPSHNAFVSTLTLSFPAFFLAIWARPGPLPEGSLTRRMMHFVVPAVLTISAAGLFVYLFFLASSMIATGAPDVTYAQQALTYLVIGCGLLLIVFVEPPTPFWVGGDKLSGDWRPTVMAIGMFVALVVLLAIEPVRHFYGLAIFPPQDYLLIFAVIVCWALVVRYAWRRRVIERYLNLDFERN